MQDDAARSIACRLHGATVVIDLGGDEGQEVLFLTHGEAKRLASDLETELVCSGENSEATATVANVIVTRVEAWQLVDAIHDLLGIDSADHRLADIGGRVPWWEEGF